MQKIFKNKMNFLSKQKDMKFNIYKIIIIYLKNKEYKY